MQLKKWIIREQAVLIIECYDFNRPRELSSKKPVPRLRQVIPVKKKVSFFALMYVSLSHLNYYNKAKKYNNTTFHPKEYCLVTITGNLTKHLLSADCSVANKQVLY